MRSMLIKNALCLRHEDGAWVCDRKDISIADGKIAALLAPDTPRDAHAEIIDGAGLLALPGLVNAHTHSPDNLIRGTAPDLPLELWSLHSAAGRERRTPREAYVAAMLGAIEMLRTGTTTVLDHIRVSPDIDSETLNAAAQAYADVGMRAVIAPVVADRAVADTLPLDAEDLGAADISAYGRRAPLPAAEQIAVAEDFIARWHGVAGRISGAIGPSGPQRCSDRLLLAAGELSARRSLILHTHVLETFVQREMGHRLYGKPMLAHLDELGLLGARTNLVHAIWLEDDDVERIAARGATVVHNPVSNARLGSGICRLTEMLRQGVRVGLGTDSVCCNDGNNLLETTKWAAFLPRLGSHEPDDWVSPGQALELATHGSADVIGLGDSVGRLEPGKAADIVLLRLDAPAFVPLTDVVRQLVQGENGSAVDTVLVAGTVVVRGGRCVLVDEESIWAEARSLAQARLGANRGVYGQAAMLEAPIRHMRTRILHAGGCCQ
jgi:cytosine/adenosine deaminase-related metal-dependent hydrolase